MINKVKDYVGQQLVKDDLHFLSDSQSREVGFQLHPVEPRFWQERQDV
jgi:hypothetical protein